MKKVLSLMALTIVPTSLLTNVNYNFINTSLYNNKNNSNLISKSETNDNLNPFLSEIKMFKNMLIRKIFVDSNNIMWICADQGLYKSTDGIAFEQIKLDDSFSNALDLILDSLGNYYFSADNGNLPKEPKHLITVYKSSDGTTFNRIFTTNQLAASQGFLSVDATGQGIYLGTYNTIFVSGNSTSNWAPLYEFPISASSITGLLMENSLVVNDYGVYYSDTGFNYDKSTLVLSGKVHGLWQHGNKIYTLDNHSGYYVATWEHKQPKFSKVVTTVDTTTSWQSMIIDNNNNFWAISHDQLFKSTDGINFMPATNWSSDLSLNVVTTFKNQIFLGGNHGLYQTITDPASFLDMASPDYQGEAYDGWVFTKNQTIGIKNAYLKSAVLDGRSLTIPSDNIAIDESNNGKHHLVLTLNDEIKSSALLFKNGNANGEISYNFWIKPEINPEVEINYQTNTGNTDLLTGLISDYGNTINKPIINTRAKAGSSHSATLNITINSDLIDLENSYYVLGTVDETKNDFNPTPGTTQPLKTKITEIKNNGIYHLFLIDLAGNPYESYLELGQENWKIKGTFNDEELKVLSAKLNVTTNLNDPEEEQEALSWLHQYDGDLLLAIKNSIQKNSKGFLIDENALQDYYLDFLGAVIYLDPNTKEDIKTDVIDSKITAIANQMLSDGLNGLPELNVKTDNVVDKKTLDNYTTWINGYQKYINNNQNQWFDNIVKAVAREFATPDEIKQINEYLKQLPFNNYLQQFSWTPEQDNEYLQFIELTKMENDISNWVATNVPGINQAWQAALKTAESDLTLHGYTINDLLAGKELPQTKSQIETFANGLSFHNWLQTQADSYYHSWQLKMALWIGIPCAAILSFIGIIAYWRYSKKYNPGGAVKRWDNPKILKKEAKKLEKQEKDKLE